MAYDHAAYMRKWWARGGPAVERRREKMKIWNAANATKRRRYGRASRQRRAGLHLTQAEELLVYEASDGLCALCLTEPATQIDHDHETGEVRGAICGRCNRGLGLLGDTTDDVRNALEYLETSPVLY